MYNSKYYTCEQIDQRLLDGYYDDAVAAGYTGSKAQYLAGLLKAINYSANPTITADKIVYNPAISGLTHRNIQDAIDELANKKFDKENIAQDFGESKDKVMSQKAITDKLTELEKKQVIYNLDVNVPLSSGQFYTPTTARNAIPTSIRKIGLIITYKTDATTWVMEQFIGASISNWGEDSNWKNVGSHGGNKILEWNTDVYTTRKSVPLKERKAGMQISYLSPTDGWINEQYVGTSLTDTEWINDKNWQRQINYINTNNKQSFIASKNLLSNVKWRDGYILNGSGQVISDSSGLFSLSDILPVIPNKTYTLTHTKSKKNIHLSFLDKNGRLINPNNWGYNVATKTFTTPENCVAIQFYALTSDIENNLIQLEYGAISTKMDKKNYSIQEELHDEYQSFVYDEDNVINQLEIVKMSISTDGTNTLNKNGYALTPFKVSAGDVIYSYGCYNTIVYGNNSSNPLFAFFSKDGDFTTVDDFISTATFISNSTTFNGKTVVPEGANYAVIFRLRNNPYVNFKASSLDGPIILINKEYRGYKSKRSIPDVDLRHDMYDGVDRHRQANMNFGLFYWDGIDNKGSQLMSYNGFFLSDSNLKLAQYVKEASEELKRYGIARSVQLDEDTTFSHSNANQREIQARLSDLYYKDAYLIEEITGYYDIFVQYSILVKYDGDASDLSEFVLGKGGYNLGTVKVNSIIKLDEGVYLLASRMAIERIAKSSVGASTKFNYDKNVRGSYLMFKVPEGIKCEVGGFFLWVARTEREYELFAYSNEPIFIPLPYKDSNGINNRDVLYPSIKTFTNSINRVLYSGFNNSNIVWIGTSVPNEPPLGEGYTRKYPEFVASLLQANVTVRAIGGTKMTYNPDKKVYGLSMTLEEYNSHKSEVGAERSYETQLDGCWDSDLFVFDHLHNDNGLLAALKDNPEYWDSDLQTFKITERNKFDRTWAVGAFNYVIAEIFRYNPRAKIAIINDWRVEPFYNQLANRVVADLWGIPICELRLCNGNVDITTTKDTYLKRYNGGANIKLLAGSSANPLYYQTKSAPDESASVVEKETEITFNKGSDSIHPGRYGRIMYAKAVARWMLNNCILDNDKLYYYY